MSGGMEKAAEQSKERIAVIAGAGPAGLTVASELSLHSDVRPVVFESASYIGGISRTVIHNGNRIDIGGHRFFSKNKHVMEKWVEIMPMQTAPALDELLTGAHKGQDHSHDPEQEDRVLLRRRRVSRIYYLRKFFDYPISLSLRTISALGLTRTLKAGFGYLRSLASKHDVNSLEDYYVSCFGRPLYKMFFERYTEKVWGVHPSKLGADWGAQRVKGLSLSKIIKDRFLKLAGVRRDASGVETSLIEEFLYPKYGPGQLWETLAEDIEQHGGEVHLNAAVSRVHVKGNRVVAVTVRQSDGSCRTVGCDYFISSMPIKDLIAAIEGIDVPEDVKRIASELPYRDFITVGLLVDKLKIRNETKLKTYRERIPDTWIYVQDGDVRLGRIQIFNNWSPYMVRNYREKVWLGLEYFCEEGDWMWNMSDRDFIEYAAGELESIGIIDSKDVEDSIRIKMSKAYPAYYGSYNEFGAVRQWLDGIANLYCIGRNGQHRYNNMDHSMLTAMEAANNIMTGRDDKEDVWNVNTEQDYHEDSPS